MLLGVVVLLALLALVDAGGRAELWENGYWTLAFLIAFEVALSGARTAIGGERRVRAWLAAGIGCWAIGQIIWDIQAPLGIVSVPAPSDAAFLLTFVPLCYALSVAVRQRVGRSTVLALHLDAATLFVAVATIAVALVGSIVSATDTAAALVLLAYPVLFLGLAGAGAIAVLALRAEPAPRGIFAVLGGSVVVGLGWVPWIAHAPAVPAPGSPSNLLFAIGMLAIGYGATTWSSSPSRRADYEHFTRRLLDVLPIVAALVATGLIVVGRLLDRPYFEFVEAGALVVVSLAVMRQSLVLGERGRLAAVEREARAEIQRERDFTSAVVDTAAALVIVLDREGRVVRFNRACEQLTGYHQEEIAGRRFWEVLLPPEEVDSTLAVFRRLQAGNFPATLENRWLARDGRRPLLEWSATALVDPSGAVEYVIGVGIDVTERRRASEAMVAIEDAGRLLARDGPTPDALDGVLALLNERFGYGYTSIYLFDGQLMHLGAQRGYVAPLPTFDGTIGVLGRVMRTRQPAFIPDTALDPDYVDATLGAQSEICAPLLLGGELLGALNVETVRGTAPLDEQDLRVLETIADRLASALVISRGRQELADRSARLLASEEQTRHIIETATDAYVGLDADGLIVDWNEQAEATFGWLRDEVVGRSLAEVVFRQDRRAAQEAALFHAATPAADRTPQRRVEFEARHRDGRSFPVEVTIWPVQLGGTYRFSAFIHDISLRKQLEEELRFQAFHDPLTGLANRTLLAERVDHALRRRPTEEGRVCLLFIDLDDFKTINDSLGHMTGDQLLVAAASRITAAIRPEDTAARLGGDEFAILLEDGSESVAAEVAGRVLSSLEAPFELAGKQVFVTGSVGIAVADEPEIGVDELIRNADMAMYMAKTLGKGRCEVFEAGMHRAAIHRLELRGELQAAIEHDQFSLRYQPIVDLVSGRMTGLEALLRWEHPTRGTVQPAEFVPLAEETSLILPIGRWVLREACRRARDWQLERSADMPLSIAVNISGRQLHHPTLVDEIGRVLADTDLPPETLILELTEGTLMQDTDQTLETFRRLKALGVRLAIDDFGTGYSSLSYLHRFPIDIVKIDRSFVSALQTGAQDAALVRAIIKLAHSLGLETIAEGVERQDQLQRLRKLGARYGQGFLFARPMPLEAVEDLLGREVALVPEPVPGRG